MSRAIVTPELADMLRNLRNEYKVQAKELAEHLKKSRSFISRLENGTIKTIDSRDLYSALTFILGSDSDMSVFLEKIYDRLQFKYTQKEIRQQLWFYNYDTVLRSIPIPPELIQYINGLITELGISADYLLNRINSNESIPDSEKNDTSIPYNEWYRTKSAPSPLDYSIKIDFSANDFYNILSMKKDTSPYVYMLSIIFYLIKYKEYGEQVDIPLDEYKDLYSEAIDCLNKYKFYSIDEKRRILSSIKNDESEDLYLSIYEIENKELLSKISKAFHAISEFNLKYANRALSDFSDNLDSDLGFMMGLISLKYTDLKEVSVSNKRELLKEIRKLINKYASLSAEENSIETY